MHSTRKLTEIDGRNAIYSVFFSSDGKQVLSGGDEGMIRRWQADDGREANEAIQAGSSIYAAALSMDQKRLVCGLSMQPRVRVWDPDTHTKVLDIYDHAGTVQSVDISSDSTKFATCGADKCAFIWSLNTGKVLVGPVKHDSTLVSVRFAPDGARFATATVGKSIRIFDSDNGQRLLDIPCAFGQWISSPLAWSADGRHLFAVSAPLNGLKCFDSSSGTLFSGWHIPGALDFPSITPSSNKKFVAVAASRSLSFWDVSTRAQIGPMIEHGHGVYFVKLSVGDDHIVTGEQSGKITVRSLRDILPEAYFTGRVVSASTAELDIDESTRGPLLPSHQVQLPLLKTSDATFHAWTKGDLTRAEQILTEEILHTDDPSHLAQVLAHRSLVRSRLKQFNLAIDDAKRSVEIHRSTVGHVAATIARAGNGEPDAAIRVFDLVIADGLSAASEGNLILLVKIIVLFECGRHDEAILRIEDMIDIVGDKAMYVTILAQIYCLLGCMSLDEGDYERAAELLGRARKEAAPPKECPVLVVISLMFGWDFDALAPAIEEHLQRCMQTLGDIGDVAMQRGDAEEAIARYSAALSLNPSNLAGLLFKRSRARAILELWEDALEDADEAIKADPQDPWGYERRHAALHALQRCDEAVDVLKHMISLTKEPLDSNMRCKCHCGGGDDALGHLIETMMARSGEATVLAWTGNSSSYNSCLPASLAIHGSPATDTLLFIEEAEMDARVAELRNSMSPTDAMLIYDRVIRLPPPRFTNRRLCHPCIVFPVKQLVKKEKGAPETAGGGEECYRARVSGIGHVEFRTSSADRFLSFGEEPPRKLVFVHPWIRDLRGLLLDEVDLVGNMESDGEDYCCTSESWSDSETEVEGELLFRSRSRSLADHPKAGPVAAMDGDRDRALQLVARLQQPFCALLLQQQMKGGYKRVATEHEIVLRGLERRVRSAKEIRIEVVEIS